jgi:Na+/proline symporter
LFGYLAYFGGAFFLLRWWKLAERTRFRRFGMFPVLLAGCLSWILVPLWPDFSSHGMELSMVTGPIVLTLSAIIVQIVSPWEEPAPRPIRRVRLRYA